MDITFTIIVPIYNIEKYLEECLRSLIQQTYQNIEIILVDDGSVDGSGSICDHYKNIDKRIKVIHKKNGGLTSARKAGLLIATGDYIVPIDGDDWVDPEYINAFAEVLNTNQPDIICGGYVRETPSGSEVREYNSDKGFYNETDIKDKFYPRLIQPSDDVSIMLSVWGKAFKKDVYTKAQMNVDEGFNLAEDIACVVPCILDAKSIYVTDACYYHYRILQQSMSNNRVSFSWDVPKRLYEHLIKVTEKYGSLFEQQIAQRIVRESFFAATSEFLKGESYLNTRKKVKTELNGEYIKQSIKKSRFKPFHSKVGTIYWVYQTMLKYRLFLLMNLYIKTR